MKILGKIKGFFHHIQQLLNVHPICFCLVLAPLLNLLVESLSRHSFWLGLRYLALHPVFFLLNAAMIYASYAVAILFPKRTFAVTIASAFWLILGIINCVLLMMRVTPLTAIDFEIFWTGLGIITVYLTIAQIVAISLSILLLLAGMILLAVKSKKISVNFRRFCLNLCLSFLVLTGLVCGTRIAGYSTKNYEYLPDAYDHYGYLYCLSCCMFDRGVDKPDDYSEKSVDEVLELLREKENTTPERTPNIIIVQLESFFDMNHITGLQFSENPVPTFEHLKDTCTSGFLTVPSVGCGTANTEFEVLSGLNLDYFGTGEYPYETILKSSCCETLCFNLKELGYGTHAIHNHTGTFYDRNRVYANLGFDTFQPLEYMTHVETNSLGWAKDSILTNEILEAVNSTDTPDFVFTVSVQGHGQYPSDYVPSSKEISLTGIDDPALASQYCYYANQLKEIDTFISELTQAFSSRKEDTVIIFYGDHLPSLEVGADQIDNHNLLQTEYVIWSNFDLPQADCDLESYQLSSYLCEQLGITDGFINKLHQSCKTYPRYQQLLNLLEYDMLYGDFYMYNSEFPYQPTQLQMGTLPVTVSSAKALASTSLIYGANFTSFSQVMVNGRKKDTTLFSDSCLKISDYTLRDGDRIVVKQVSQDLTELSETAEYIYHSPSD